jgi:pimeloyl-ACP methyl ester carboxylesterase
LKISQCSIIAHSAGAPYALSFANRVPERIRGDICLLAPWVGGSESGGGYKWLKYVPNGILKTAQAAEWKIQAWMIGKPPTIAYEGIGHIASSPSPSAKSTSRKVFARANTNNLTVNFPNRRRPSIESNTFSEYDDLGDFDGRFESRSTLGATSAVTRCSTTGWEDETKKSVNKRKASKGFLGRLKGGTAGSQTQSSSPIGDRPLPPSTGRRLKALRSMGSLKGRSSVSSTVSRASDIPPSPQLPEPCPIEIGLGFDDVDWTKSITSEPASTPNPRAGGRRSISFTTNTSPPSMRSAPASPIPSTFSSPYANQASGSSYQTTLGNALIAASHAESVNGLHSDLMQILNHENHPWGFSYSVYPHNVRVWYGDKDEKIAENAVRWMERNMGEDRCRVKVVNGADHGLMYKSAVVVEVLERVREYWRDDN